MILTLVTFIPAIGAVVLMLMPRNDRVIRVVALAVSLLAFAFSVCEIGRGPHARPGR